VLGCATAYFLARSGQRNVTLFERTGLGAGTTSRAAALFNRARSCAIERRMVRDTQAVIGELEAELGEGLGFRRVGSPHLEYCPVLAHAALEHYVAVPSAYTPDGAFVVDKVATAEGLIALTGCCGAGIAHSAGFGRSGAALALGGDLPYDLTPCRPERFGEFDPMSDDYCRRCAATRARKTAA